MSQLMDREEAIQLIYEYACGQDIETLAEMFRLCIDETAKVVDEDYIEITE